MALRKKKPVTDSSPDPSATVAAKNPAVGGKADQLKVIGGLLALVAGLIALLGVLALAIAVRVTELHFSQLAATVIGVIGSIVGAYFGVKIGSDGTDKALESQRQEAARAQIFAAHLPPAEAAQALELAFAAGLLPAGVKPPGAKPEGSKPEEAKPESGERPAPPS